MIKNKIFFVILFNCKILFYKHIFSSYIFRIYILDTDKIAVFVVGKKKIYILWFNVNSSNAIIIISQMSNILFFKNNCTWRNNNRLVKYLVNIVDRLRFHIYKSANFCEMICHVCNQAVIQKNKSTSIY